MIPSESDCQKLEEHHNKLAKQEGDPFDPFPTWCVGRHKERIEKNAGLEGHIKEAHAT